MGWPYSREWAGIADGPRPWNAACGGSGDGPAAGEAWRLRGGSPRLSVEAQDHGEAKAQEGKVGCRDTNHGPMMRIDSREEESPEDEKMVLCHAILGNGQHARRGLHLGLETRPTCGRNVKRARRR